MIVMKNGVNIIANLLAQMIVVIMLKLGALGPDIVGNHVKIASIVKGIIGVHITGLKRTIVIIAQNLNKANS